MTTAGLSLGLEVPAFGAAAAAQAVALGATRIELNALGSYTDGGTTPSVEDLKEFCTTTTTATANSKVPLRIMIRPRGPPPSSDTGSNRDFVYSEREFETMLGDIQGFKDSGLLDVDRGDGFVFGILKEDEDEERDDVPQGGDVKRKQKQRRCWVDRERCVRLVRATRPFKSVFHRAFDEIVSCDDSTPTSNSALASTTPSWETSLEAVATCGFSGILTSGGLGKAIDNVATLEKIIRKVGVLGTIEIIVGGGVRTANVKELVQRLGLRDNRAPSSVYLHSACLCADGSESINPDEVKGILARVT